MSRFIIDGRDDFTHAICVRNLEYIHPTTVSKHKSGMSRLFQQIVDYPMPKPRSIEKDVKVFPWTRLEEALKKILHKYVSIS